MFIHRAKSSKQICTEPSGPLDHLIAFPSLILLRLALIPLIIFVSDGEDGLAVEALSRPRLTLHRGSVGASTAFRGRSYAAHAAKATCRGAAASATAAAAKGVALEIEVVVLALARRAVGRVQVVEAVAAVDGTDLEAVVVLGELYSSSVFSGYHDSGTRDIPRRTWQSGGCSPWVAIDTQ